MDVRYIAVLLAICGSTQGMVDEAAADTSVDPNIGDVPTTLPPSTESTTSPAPVNCQTPRGGAGVCAVRNTCDYGTTHIDRTLYAPRGYLKTCKDEEVCCPLEYIIENTKTPSQHTDNDDDGAFAFDEDD